MACRRDGAPAGTARRRPARQREGTHTTTSASPFCGGADPNQLIKVVGCEVRRISMTQPADRLHSISSGIGIRTAANEFSARVLVNTGSSLIQAGIEEKKRLVSVPGTRKSQGLGQAPALHVYIQIYSELASCK